MPRKTPKPIRYARGSYKPIKTGGYLCYITLLGKSIRRVQPDEAAARHWLETASGHTTPLTRYQLQDAHGAIALLKPGDTLTAIVAAHYASAATSDILTEEAVLRFLAAIQRRVQHISYASYRQILNALVRSAPPQLSDLTVAHIQHLSDGKSRTRHNTILTHVRVFTGWAVREGYLRDDLGMRISKLRSSEPPKGVLTPSEWAQLFATAETKPEYARALPYLALGCFAGIRPAELHRLTSDAIGAQYITIAGAHAKTASHRTIPIEPNLRAWITAYPPAKRICCLTLHPMLKLIARIRKAAGITHWPSDCMRHSYASYHYERGKNANETAANMGHAGTAVFFKHYRALSTPNDGEKYFSIAPSLCILPS